MNPERVTRSFAESQKWAELMEGSVITEDGRPFPQSPLKRIFHGSSKQFEFFQSAYMRNEAGLHAGSANVAHKRLQRNDAGEFQKGSRLYPLYFNIKRPLVLDDRFRWEITNPHYKADIVGAIVRDEFIAKGAEKDSANAMMYMARAITAAHRGHSEESIRKDITQRVPEYGNNFLDAFLKLFGEINQCSTVEDVIDWLEKQGYDGFAYMNVGENYHEEDKDISYIALRPHQVRSAITGEQLWVDEKE